MKTLLLLPRLEPNTNPPLGLAYIAAVVRQAGYEIEICDATFEDKAFVFKRLERADFGLLGVNSFTMSFNLGLEFAKFAKAKNPGLKVIFGGVHPTILYPEVIKNDVIDFVGVGEGEYLVKELLDALTGKRGLEGIEGLVYKVDGIPALERYRPRPLIRALDDLPFPARDLLPMKDYLAANFGRTAWSVLQPATTIITTRGCPFHCTYCSSHLMFGRTTRYRSPANIAAEIEALVRDYGVRGLSIVDDTFIISRKQVNELSDEFRRRNLRIEFICNGRVDTVDRETIHILKGMGCVGIAFGVESGSQKILDEMLKKGIRLEQVRNAFHWAYQEGIPTDAYFMIGIPGEKEADIRETIRFSKTLKATAANFSITIPMPKTELFDLAEKTGEICVDGLEDFDYTGKPIYRSKDLDLELLKRLRRKAVIGFYFNLRYLLEQVFSVRSFSDVRKKIRGLGMLLKIIFRI